ncbi:MAG: hypothetical protein AAGG75_18390, partial [Bacteroidota bacterium]
MENFTQSKQTALKVLGRKCCSLSVWRTRLFGLLLLFSLGQLNAQNTPLGTPAAQNADGSTATPGTPAACAAGFGLYTIDHEDASLGFLPGGFCVTTELVNSGTTPVTVTGTPNGSGIGDVDNIVVDGGRINYSSTDGGDLDATYTFCETITNPYVFIGDLETFTTINFFDCAGNPINVNLMNGQSRFAVSGNSALITGTTSTNQDGYVQVPGSYDCLVINIDNPAPFTLDVIQISVGVCMPTPPTGNMTCPYDLLMWKKDAYCAPVYRDADGVFYEKDQNNNNIASLGDELWTNTPICGELVLLESDCAIQDNNCTPDFTCDAIPVEVQFREPMGSGCLFSTYWYDITSFPINDPSPGNQWSAIFSGTDAFGLPAHPSAPTLAAENCGLDWLGDNEGDIDFDDEAGGANEDEQLQMDGWLYVASHLECIQFRVGSSATDHSVGLYVGTDLNNMTLVAQENDEQAGGSNNADGVVGSYCIPDMVSTTRDECGWQILRVRIYAHDDDTAYDPAIDWSFNGGLTWDVVEEQWFVAATSADDNTPPTGVAMGGGGCNPIPTTTVDMDNVLVDLEGKIWQIPGNCGQAPTNLYEPNIPNGNNAEEGDHLPLIPYCIVYNDDVAIDCDPCAIDIAVEGCACSNPDNMFADDCIQSVTAYQQTLIVNSDINTTYTITASSGISGLAGPFMTAGTSETYTFFVSPGTPYSITLMGDQSMTSQTFEGLCSAPDACNCPTQPEICGDGLDNDCDGAVDEADSDITGNCALDCTPTPTPVEIQGRAMQLDGRMTHQVWSRECGGTGCCPSSINPHSCALTAFTCTDVNGLPQHNSACGPTDPCAPAGPPGTAGCTGNDVFTLFGSTHFQAPQFYSTAAEQTQLDGWLVLPPGITCFELKVNNPRAWDAQAVYMGAGIASMNFVGASSFPPAENYTDAVDCQNDTNNNPNVTGENFQYDISSGATPITVAGCTWNVIRIRAYIFDESWYHVTPVQWNIGNGFETIPSRYLQSVGPDGWDTDNNQPTVADVVELAPYCAYMDGDGDLFTMAGDFFTLDPQQCEQIMESACLNCPPFYDYDCGEAATCVEFIEIDPTTGNPVPEVPECDLELFTITPMVLDNAGSPGSGLLTRYWDHDQANCVSDAIQNESIFCAFSGYDPNAANCPNCLPEHPNFNSPTEADLIVGTLGTNTLPFANDVDNDGFRIRALNRRSGENVQQDGWLLVPPDVNCIAFRVSSLAWDASALYLGTGIDNMTFVGENINRNGNNPIDTFYYELPANAQTVACTSCDNQDFTLLRVRSYHHDNNMGANSIWEWNISGDFRTVPEDHLFPVADHCSDNMPVDLCPTYTAGTPFIAVLEDANSNQQFDAGEKWFRAPAAWTGCDAARANFDQNMIPALEPVAIDACDMVDRIDCSLCCELIVTCPDSDQGEFDCLTDVPAPVTTEAGFEALLGMPDIDDNFCGTLTITSMDSDNGATGCIGDPLILTRVYTIADDNDMTTCTVTYTIIDDVDPVLAGVPASTTVECDAVPPQATPTASDNCDTDVVITFEEVRTNGNCPFNYTLTRTWTATDDCGNTDIQTQVITVQDTSDPTPVCQNITVEVNGSGEVFITPDMLNGGSTDNCSTNLSFSASRTMFNCSDIPASPIDVTLTVTDECGNSSTCVAQVTVVDVIPPTLNCPSDQVITLDPGDCSAIVNWNVTATDNCEEVMTTTFLGTTFIDNNGFAGNMFDITNIGAVPITIDRFDVHLETGAGTPHTVAAYYVTGGGTYVGNETDATAWTLMGDVDVTSAGPGNPSEMPAAGLTSFTINPGETYGIYIFQSDGGSNIDYTNGANTYTDANMQISTGLGRGTPIWTGGVFNPRTWNGNVYYSFTAVQGVVVEQISGPPSGTAFEHGTSTTIEYKATDGSGNMSFCSWTITVEEWPLVDTELACNNNINVSLDENCTATIGADLILEGGQYGCYDTRYQVIIDLNGDGIFDPAEGNMLDASNLGQTYDVQVMDLVTGNSCWGTIDVEDKLIPDLVCQDTMVLCSDDLSPEALGFPLPAGATATANPDGSYTVTGFDPCSDATLTFVDSDDPRQCQATNNVITRTWTIVDGSGNMKTCDQLISLTRATLADVIAPPNYDGIDQPALNCEDRCDPDDTRFCGPDRLYWNVLPAGHPFAGNPNPEDELWGCGLIKCFGTGMPAGANCGDIQQTFEDVRINICATGPSESCFKILRRWTVLDWCTGETRFIDQVIKVEDTEGPVINDIDDVTISTDVWRCEADWFATEAWLMDNCSSDPLDYIVESTGGTVSQTPDGRWLIEGLAPGTYTVTYIASDCCGNETREDIILTVIDDVPPVVVCDAQTVVALTTTQNINTDNLGLTKIPATSFDDGSFDNCASE